MYKKTKKNSYRVQLFSRLEKLARQQNGTHTEYNTHDFYQK